MLTKDTGTRASGDTAPARDMLLILKPCIGSDCDTPNRDDAVSRIVVTAGEHKSQPATAPV